MGKKSKSEKSLYLGTNTKMYWSIAETCAYLTALKQLTADLAGAPLTLFIIPSFTSLDQAGQLLKNSPIKLGAQNMCWADEGQYTGEISPPMLKETGVSIVEIGHSERRHPGGSDRRQSGGESNHDIRRKTLAAAAHNFTPLLCIGETAGQRRYGISDEVLRVQLKIALHSLTPQQARQLWIAYEPVWAIGVNGVPAAADYVADRHAVIRMTLNEQFGAETGGTIPLLYGGSVNRQNAAELIGLPDVDGLFIGRSAWRADDFNQIIRKVLPVYLQNKL